MSFTNTFASIPTRNNSDLVDSNWWNFLQIAGAALESIVTGGAAYISSKEVSLVNNQSSAFNVTGLAFDHTVTSSATVPFEARINTSTTELVAVGKMTCRYLQLTSTWDMIVSFDGDDPGLTLSITSAGQVQYTSTNVGGSSYVGTLKFSASTYGV